MEEILAWVKALPGVRQARLDMLNDRIEVPENFEAILRQTLASSVSPRDLQRLRLPAPFARATRSAMTSALSKQ